MYNDSQQQFWDTVKEMWCDITLHYDIFVCAVTTVTSVRMSIVSKATHMSLYSLA